MNGNAVNENMRCDIFESRFLNLNFMIDLFILRTVNSIGFAVLNNDVPAYFADVNFLVKFIWNVQIFSFSAFSGCRIRRHSFDSGKRHHHECHAQRQQNCQNPPVQSHFHSLVLLLSMLDVNALLTNFYAKQSKAHRCDK